MVHPCPIFLRLRESELKRIFLDTETTSLSPGQIAQLTYIVTEGGDFTKAKNYFFRVDRMNPFAQRVHGFSIDLLDRLSMGRKFGDHAEEIRNDFDGSLIVCHNADFDRRFIDAEFERIGMDCESEYFCTMKHFRNRIRIPGHGFKNPKLSELSTYFKVTREEVAKRSAEFFESDEVDYHDARFDTICLYEIFQKAEKAGYI